MNYQDLLAYQKEFSLEMKIFDLSKSFPKEENEEVGKLINYMIRNPNKFGVKTNDD